MISIQGSNAFAIKAFDLAGPTGFAGVRVLFGALALLLVVRPKIWGHSPVERRLTLLFGIVIALNTLVLYEAFARLPLGIAITVAFLGPLGVSVANSHRTIDLIWPVLAAAGVVLLAVNLSGGGTAVNSTGLVFAALSAAGWAAYILLSAAAGARFGGLEGLATATVFAAVLLIPIAIGSAGSRLLDLRLIAIGGASGILTFGLANSLETHALRRVSKHLFGLFASIEPVIAALAGLLFLSQDLSTQQLVGIGLVTFASAAASRWSQQESLGL